MYNKATNSTTLMMPAASGRRLYKAHAAKLFGWHRRVCTVGCFLSLYDDVSQCTTYRLRVDLRLMALIKYKNCEIKSVW